MYTESIIGSLYLFLVSILVLKKSLSKESMEVMVIKHSLVKVNMRLLANQVGNLKTYSLHQK